LLGRNGGQIEINAFVQAMLDGTSEEDVITTILSSDEYRSRFASQDLFIAGLYQDLLGRAAGPDDLAVHNASLNGGTSREALVKSILTSPEARVRQLTALYRQQLLRTPGAIELASYEPRFGSSNLITDVGVEIAASDEMFALGRQFIPTP
jgi:hypothetical protein